MKRKWLLLVIAFTLILHVGIYAATLTTQERNQVWKRYMRQSSADWSGLPCTKLLLMDAVIATDVWIDDNQGSFNSSLPTCVRQNFTQKQKLRLFMEVAKIKFEVE